MAQLPSTNAFPFSHIFFPCSRRFCVTSGTFTIKSASIVGNCLAIMQFKRRKKNRVDGSTTLHQCFPFFPIFFPVHIDFAWHLARLPCMWFAPSIVGNCLQLGVAPSTMPDSRTIFCCKSKKNRYLAFCSEYFFSIRPWSPSRWRNAISPAVYVHSRWRNSRKRAMHYALGVLKNGVYWGHNPLILTIY